MSKIDDLNIQPKFDNALQVARTASIPSNEKYTASEWNALISKTNEVVGRANLNTWNIVTNYSELPTDPVNGQKVYVTGTGLTGHVGVQMMPNANSSRGFYVYDAFSDIWVQKTSESGGGLATDMSNLDDDILEADKKVIREKLGAAYEGLNNTNSGELSGSLAGFNNDNSGNGSGSVGGESNTNSGVASCSVGGGGIENIGDYSGSVGGADNTNSGKYSGSVGGQLLENKTYAETSIGLYNLSESNHADSDTVWHDDDLIESVGGGDDDNNRFNLFARYKSGAFYWIKKTLSTITNAVEGFHAADEDGRLNYHDGTDWKKYLLEGEGSGGGYIEILNQFNDVNGEIDLDLITEEGTYVLKTGRDEPLNGLPQYRGDGPVNVQIDVFKSGVLTYQRAIYFSYTQTIPSIAYRIHDSVSYTDWADMYEILDNKSYNGVTPTVTASVVTSYDIDPQLETEHWNLTMTGDTDFDFTNMFASGNSKVITITLEGDYAFTFPSWLKSLETNDDYDTIGGTLAAEIVINIKNGGATPSGYYSLQMIDYAL